MKKKDFVTQMHMARVKRVYGRQSHFTMQRSGWVFHIKIPTIGNGIRTVQQIHTKTQSYAKAAQIVASMATKCAISPQRYAETYSDVKYDPNCGQC